MDEVTFVEAVAGCSRAAANERRAIFAANVDVTQHRFELTLVDTWSHVSLRIRTGTDAHRLGSFRDAFDKLVRNLIDNDGATRCRATLAGRSKRALCSRFNGEIHVGVFENHNGILPAHLALNFRTSSGRLF